MFAFPLAAAAIVCLAAGRWDLPLVWAVFGVLTGFLLVVLWLTEPGLVRERMSPGPGNRDRVTRPVSLILLVGHWLLVGVDLGRYQWTVVPTAARVAGLVGYALCLSLLLWAMRANRFYSSVVRIQRDRDHATITTGPYQYVRHPGYAASLLAGLSGGMALGSWLGMLPLLAFFALFVRRTLLEDRLLHRELEGYAEYAQRVRYRLIPGIF